MKIHEYQARQLLQDAGVPVPGGIVVESAEEAEKAFNQLAAKGCTLAVVKAQVHAGGRGKGGGVQLVRDAATCKEKAELILSKNLITPQTPPEGIPVKKLLIADGVDIEKEYYVAMLMDRKSGKPVMIASSEGGMNIEEVAEKTPELIIRQIVDPALGLQAYQARELAFAVGFKGKQLGQAVKAMMNLSKLFLSSDASLAEINPLVVTPATEAHPDGQVLAIDAKFDFDDNAMFRQKAIAALGDPSEEDEAELRAAKYDLNFIALDGTIGCLVNGAGLAMATMDIIKLHGQDPANFLDIGGSATEEAVTEAFKIILDDKKVKGILVNIFGGIAKCDTIANAIIAAAKEVGFSIPLVVRVEGTNVDLARELLANAKKDIPTLETATDLTDAAQKITALVG